MDCHIPFFTTQILPRATAANVARADALTQGAQVVAYDNVIAGAIRCLVTVYDTDVRM